MRIAAARAKFAIAVPTAPIRAWRFRVFTVLSFPQVSLIGFSLTLSAFTALLQYPIFEYLRGSIPNSIRSCRAFRVSPQMVPLLPASIARSMLGSGLLMALQDR